MDAPNERSLHVRPVPRTGGVAIVFATLVGGIYTVAGGRVEFSAGFGTGAHGFAMMVVWGGLAVLAIVSFFDDALSLAPLWRLLVQIGVAAAIVKAVADLGVWQTAFAVLLMVWMVNLYNFMDGMDGFAAGMAVVGFGALSVVAKLQGAEAPAEGCAIVAGAALGFLFINFPPARLFMGDLGSTLLGALAGLMLLVFHQEGILPVWLGILIFSPFVVDATVTLIRRVLRGERFWEAHRQHYYQRLVRRGWGHRKTVLAEYVLMALTASSAVIANGLPLRLQWAIIGVWVLIYAVLMYAIDRTEPKENEAAPV